MYCVNKVFKGRGERFWKNSDIPLAIVLSNSYRNIGLILPSDFNYRTSYIGLPIVRYLSYLLKSTRQKMGNFYLFYVFIHKFFAVLTTLPNFRKNTWVVGWLRVMLLISLLSASLLLRVYLLELTLWCSYYLCCSWPPSMLLPASLFLQASLLLIGVHAVFSTFRCCWRPCWC